MSLIRWAPTAIKIGDTVRLVEMNGCMAHVRGNVREGVVVGFQWRQVYGDTKHRDWAQIKLEDGSITEYCADEKEWWPGDDGVMEYRM